MYGTTDNRLDRPGWKAIILKVYKWDPIFFKLTTLSATFDVAELLLRSQKMLKTHPLPLREVSILPRCFPNTSFAKAHPIFHATSYIPLAIQTKNL